MLARLTPLINTLSTARWRMVGALALAVLALAGFWVQDPVAPPRFEVLTGGQDVKDHRTGLVWRRCAEGQRWDGQHCDGEALTVPHLAALELAQSQPGWRLPTLPELYSLVETGRRQPALDAAVFPDTPGYWFWSSTLTDSRISHAWLVHFGEGEPNFALRMNHVHVRLVRS